MNHIIGWGNYEGGYTLDLVTRTVKKWMEDDAKTHSAALAFYFVLSLPALILFSISLGSIFLKSSRLQENIIEYLQGSVDQSIIDMMYALFENTPEVNFLSLGALIGFLLLLWSASNVFRQLKDFLEKAWDIKHVESSTIKDFIKNAIVSFFIVIGIGGLLVLSILIEGVLYTVSRLFREFFPFTFRCPVYRVSSQLPYPCTFLCLYTGYCRIQNLA